MRAYLTAAVLGIGTLLCCGNSEAVSRSEIRKQTELSMRVTGKVQIDAAGNVTGQSIDQADKVPQPVRDFVIKSASEWKFEPMRVNGKAVASDVTMAVRVVARPLDGANYQLRIPAIDFGDEVTSTSAEQLTAAKMPPPLYPEAAYRSGIAGTVYLIVNVGRDGEVLNVSEEQTNLKVAGTAKEMERARKLLVDASVKQAHRWQFKVPTAGAAASDNSWAIRVPIDYVLTGRGNAAEKNDETYGQWNAYIPGPRRRIPWLDKEQAAEAERSSPEALAGGSINMLGGRSTGPRRQSGANGAGAGG